MTEHALYPFPYPREYPIAKDTTTKMIRSTVSSTLLVLSLILEIELLSLLYSIDKPNTSTAKLLVKRSRIEVRLKFVELVSYQSLASSRNVNHSTQVTNKKTRIRSRVIPTAVNIMMFSFNQFVIDAFEQAPNRYVFHST